MGLNFTHGSRKQQTNVCTRQHHSGYALSLRVSVFTAPPCKTCTHVSYQQISILTLNFNTSFVGHLTNVATLEYFTLTVFLSVFVERCSRVWFGCIERYTWLANFDENTCFFWSRYAVLLDPAETLVSLVSLLSGKYAEHVALSISVYLSPFYSALSQSVFLERYRED